MANGNKLILEKLDNIRADIDFIKERMLDIDVVLTDDDIESLDEAEMDLKAGRTKRI